MLILNDSFLQQTEFSEKRPNIKMLEIKAKIQKGFEAWFS